MPNPTASRRPKFPPSEPPPAAAAPAGSLDAARAEHGPCDDDSGYCDACVVRREHARLAAIDARLPQTIRDQDAYYAAKLASPTLFGDASPLGREATALRLVRLRADFADVLGPRQVAA